MTDTPYKRFVWTIGKSDSVSKHSWLLGEYWFVAITGDGFVKPPNIYRRFVVWILFGSKYVEVDE